MLEQECEPDDARLTVELLAEYRVTARHKRELSFLNAKPCKKNKQNGEFDMTEPQTSTNQWPARGAATREGQ